MECQRFSFTSDEYGWLFYSGQQQQQQFRHADAHGLEIILLKNLIIWLSLLRVFGNWIHVKRMNSIMFYEWLFCFVLFCAQYYYCVKIDTYATHAHRTDFFFFSVYCWWCIKGQNDDDNTMQTGIEDKCDDENDNGDLYVRTFIVLQQFMPKIVCNHTEPSMIWRRKKSGHSHTHIYICVSLSFVGYFSIFRHEWSIRDCTRHFLFSTDQLQIFKLLFIFSII